MNNTEYKDWEKEFGLLAKMPKTTPFSVPTDYFENGFSEIITQSNVLSADSDAANGFIIPFNFFEKQEQTILRKINQIENSEQIGGFSVPEGYFNKLSEKIHSKIELNNHPTKKILKIWTSDFLKYAVAASFILITATALYFDNKDFEFINTNESAYFSDNDLYYIDEQMIIDHVEFSDESKVVNTLSPTDTETYIINNYSTTELIEEYR